MNHYGKLAMRHWEQHAPSRVQAMTNSEAFSTDLGVQVETQVVELTQSLEGTPAEGESYQQAVGRLTNARMRAEEAVLAELVWIETPELTLTEAREEWEATRTPDSWLASWAERYQDAPETGPLTVEVEELAQTWALPPELLEELLAAEVPSQFLTENAGVLAEAANIRFLREQI